MGATGTPPQELSPHCPLTAQGPLPSLLWDQTGTEPALSTHLTPDPCLGRPPPGPSSNARRFWKPACKHTLPRKPSLSPPSHPSRERFAQIEKQKPQIPQLQRGKAGFECQAPDPRGFPGGARGKENLPADAGGLRDVGSIPGSGRSPGGGHGNPLQGSCLENPMDRGAWRAAVHRVSQGVRHD